MIEREDWSFHAVKLPKYERRLTDFSNEKDWRAAYGVAVEAINELQLLKAVYADLIFEEGEE